MDVNRWYEHFPHRFKVSDLVLHGLSPKFHCLHCQQPVEEAATIDGLGLLTHYTIILFCHGQHVRVELSPRIFNTMLYAGTSAQPWNYKDMTFVVGFEGDWEVRIRNYDGWLLKRPRFIPAALGSYHQPQLERLFVPVPLGGYGLDSACFDLVNTPHDITIPAEFWFTPEDAALLVPNSPNPCAEIFLSS